MALRGSTKLTVTLLADDQFKFKLPSLPMANAEEISS